MTTHFFDDADATTGNSRQRALILKGFSLLVLVFMLLLQAGCTPEPAAGDFSPQPTNQDLDPTAASSLATQTLPARVRAANTPQPIASQTATVDLNCTYTPYYWENNPDAWLTQNIIIGRLTYQKADALKVFNNENQELPKEVLRQFFTAALNILKGADPKAIENEMVSASEWLSTHPQGLDLTEIDQETASELVRLLSAFNSGEIGPGPCADEPNTPTPSPTMTGTPTPFVTLTPRIPLQSATATATQKPRSGQPGGGAPTATHQPPTQAPPTATKQPPPPTATRKPDNTPTSPPDPPTQPPPVDTPAPAPEVTIPPAPDILPSVIPNILPTLTNPNAWYNPPHP